MTSKTDLKTLIKSLPEQAGVYQFFDKDGEIIYIGKAKNLKKRVSSYFSRSKFESLKQKVLVNRISDVRYVVVNNESDALLLENNLIKKHQPRYNVMLKDDKTFPWICIKNEPFPRIFSTRKVVRDGSEYFGPFTSAYAVKILLSLIRQIYPLRTCKLNLTRENIERGKFRVCLEYHIGNCKGPCEDLQSEEEYNENIRQIRQIIKGNLTEVIDYLKTEMKNLSNDYRFEEASQFKEKIEILARYQSKSTIVNPAIHDVDVFSIVNEENEAYVNFLKVVRGAVIQAHTVEIKKKLDEPPEELLAFAITDLRSRIRSNSRELIVPMNLQEYFPDYRLTVPKQGDKKKLLDLSLRNAKGYKLDKMKRIASMKPLDSKERILKQLQSDLRLQKIPYQIECFDNSNIQGSVPVAACVVFREGRPAKKEYRHYHIKGVTGIDDFASMKEVVYRRYSRLIKENKPLPQLVIIDGGKGQLNAALKSMDQLGIRNQTAMIGIAKRLEEIYFPGDPVPLYIDKNSESLKLIQHIRNEAHRFGIKFHQQQRSGAMTDSELIHIPGIGPRTMEKMYKRFKSMKGIRNAGFDEIASEIGPSKASLVMDHLKKR